MPQRFSVSVILPTFNRAGCTAEAITSLLRQSLEPAQIIVVDDGSTDGADAVVSTFGGRVVYSRQENPGRFAAIETGLDSATSDLIWIMDDDGSRYGLDDFLADPSPLDRIRTLCQHRRAIVRVNSRPPLNQIKIASMRKEKARGRNAVRFWFRLKDLTASTSALAGSAGRNIGRISGMGSRV